MKLILAAFLALFASLAQAQTSIDLTATPCAAGPWCATVPNNIGDHILLTGSVSYGTVGFVIGKPDGLTTSFASATHGANWAGTCPPAPAVGTMSVAGVPMTGSTGTAYIWATFSCTAHLGGSGRGQGWHQVWNLVSGELAVPQGLVGGEVVR